jgi:heme exporter protein D
MHEALNTLMLICAAMGSLTFGVLVAYGMTRAGFAALRVHSRSVAQEAMRKATLLHT